MNIPLEKFRQSILKIKGYATERSYYKDISNFIVEFATSEGKKDYSATPEESSTVISREIGFPDITVRDNNRLVGWVEVKLMEDNLDNEKFQNQFKKYKDSLENILFTNLREWQLWQWDSSGEPKKEIELIFDVEKYSIGEEEKFINLLLKFFEGRPYEARTPKQLALALAKKTKLLSKQVEESFIERDEKSDLWKLKETFEQTLIQNISIHQFSNMVAETMAYSLFLAALEHNQRDNSIELSLTNAIDYLPTNVPILADLYAIIRKVSNIIPTIHKATQLLIDQLNASEITRIHQKLVEHKPGEDPVIQFYEPFLKEYDPKEREARGVYYTPKPVVDYIIKSVDWILRNKFNKEKGLADESVQILDPATGTGTFLMSAMQEIHSNIKKENASLGEEMVLQEFNKIVLNHILKHFYGFELLIAPYAIAHLKLTLEAERLGFDFNLTKKDDDKDNDRFKIYLANTLDDPSKPPQSLFGFDSIPQESESAREIKKNAPILAIIGNPPYSNFGRMNRGEWILNLLKDYKVGLKEKKINLDDDFIKFIRFAQWKLEQVNQGIFAMITSNTFIDGITHRQMRRSLMDTFDEIYIYNLHGSSRKGEVTPEGEKDENVFSIMTGVSINIFVKLPEKQSGCVVKSCDLWGLRKNKFATLLEESFEKTNWETLSPKKESWFFVVRDTDTDTEYENYFSFKKVLSESSTGVLTSRDSFAIDDSKEQLEARMRDFENMSLDDLTEKYQLRDNISVPLKRAKSEFKFNPSIVSKINYRIFDTKFIWYSSLLIHRTREAVMANFTKPNLGFVLMRQNVDSIPYCHVMVTSHMVDNRFFGSSRGLSYTFPVYDYNEKSQSNLLGEDTKRNFFTSELTQDVSEKIELSCVQLGRGDLKQTFGPEDIFYYAYAVFHSPTYRTRYAEQLKVDFPRLPITSDKELFKRLVVFGNELANLHLLGENPFDSSKTILDEQNKWNIKIGGTTPANLGEWKVADVRYDEEERRAYVNSEQYFEGVEKEVWEFMIGGYQVCEKWLKDRKKAERTLSTNDIKHYMKIVVAIRETIRIMKEIDNVINHHGGWPIK